MSTPFLNKLGKPLLCLPRSQSDSFGMSTYVHIMILFVA